MAAYLIVRANCNAACGWWGAEQEQIEREGQTVSHSVYYMKQTIGALRRGGQHGASAEGSPSARARPLQSLHSAQHTCLVRLQPCCAMHRAHSQPSQLRG